MEKPIVDIRPVNELDEIPVGKGSSFNSRLQYTLSEKKFQRLAKLDYTKFDSSAADQIINRKQDMPDGTKQFAKEKLSKAVDTLPKEFKIDAGCALSFNMKMLPSDEDLIAREG